jgi:hypothetical protein
MEIVFHLGPRVSKRRVQTITIFIAMRRRRDGGKGVERETSVGGRDWNKGYPSESLGPPTWSPRAEASTENVLLSAVLVSWVQLHILGTVG